MLGQYFKEVRRLMEIKRYPTKIMIRKRSVAEHSWFVVEIAHGLALWEKYNSGSNNYNSINYIGGDIVWEKIKEQAINKRMENH